MGIFLKVSSRPLWNIPKKSILRLGSSQNEEQKLVSKPLGLAKL
jgi:hypothetical protein